MKRIYLFFLTLLLIVVISVNDSFAQEEEKGQYYVVTTWKMTIPADGSEAELDSLHRVWHEKVVLKNDKLLRSKILRHAWGSDMRDWIVVNVYASWSDIEEAGKMQDKLIEEAWPDKMERRAFFKAFFKYTVTHSDEIYRDLPYLTK
jgi:hypothetical protein